MRLTDASPFLFFLTLFRKKGFLYFLQYLSKNKKTIIYLCCIMKEREENKRNLEKIKINKVVLCVMIYNPNLGELNEFIEKNKSLVHEICKKYRNIIMDTTYEYEDIVNTGMIGLIKAYKKWDPNKYEKVNKFSTYGFPLIHGEIRRLLRDYNKSGLRFSREIKAEFYKAYRLGILDESEEVIAKELGISKEKAKKIKEYSLIRNTISMQSVLYQDDGSDVTLEEGIGLLDDFSEVEAKELMNIFDEREKKIIQNLVQGKTQEEIGYIIGTSQVHVSRMIKKIQKKAKFFQEKGYYNKKECFSKERKERRKKGESKMSKYSKEDKEEAIKLLSETNLTYKKISEKTNIPYSTVAVLGLKHRSEEQRSRNRSAYLNKNNCEKKHEDQKEKEIMIKQEDDNKKKFEKQSKIISEIKMEAAGENVDFDEFALELERMIQSVRSLGKKDITFVLQVKA